jgi:RimJ/RimL family protein N-acetyltransferase
MDAAKSTLTDRKEAQMNRKVPAGNAPTLETERLVLRPLSTDDADALYRISNEPDMRLYQWDDEPASEATIQGLIARIDRMFSEEADVLFGVRMRGKISAGWR